jgi:hypothetical protein
MVSPAVLRGAPQSSYPTARRSARIPMLGLSVRPSCAARGRGEQREDQQRKHRPPRERACPVAQPIERVIVCPLRLWGPLRGFVSNRIEGIQLRHRPGHCRSHAARRGDSRLFAPGHWRLRHLVLPVSNFERLTGAQWPFPVIPLPIGISFYTFTQIAFLADTFRGAATNCARRIIFRSWPILLSRAARGAKRSWRRATGSRK